MSDGPACSVGGVADTGVTSLNAADLVLKHRLPSLYSPAELVEAAGPLS
jgi:hypothetical protein